jgi:hypothetical protein
MTDIILTVRGLPVSVSGGNNDASNSYCSNVNSVLAAMSHGFLDGCLDLDFYPA